MKTSTKTRQMMNDEMNQIWDLGQYQDSIGAFPRPVNAPIES